MAKVANVTLDTPGTWPLLYTTLVALQGNGDNGGWWLGATASRRHLSCH